MIELKQNTAIVSLDEIIRLREFEKKMKEGSVAVKELNTKNTNYLLYMSKDEGIKHATAECRKANEGLNREMVHLRSEINHLESSLDSLADMTTWQFLKWRKERRNRL